MDKYKKFEDLSNKEKSFLLYGDCAWHSHGVEGLPGFEMHDGPLGPRKVKDGPKEDLSGPSLPATCFPAPCLLSCSFDEDLERQIGAAMGEECILQDFDVLLAPGVNIKRNPLCGRNFEYLSEDPLLSGKMGAAFVNGIQSTGVGATIKHFACNSQEKERMLSDSIVDPRALHELYLEPFEIAIKESSPYAVMSSYNKINGTYASDNDYLLKTVLRDEWGYQGVVMSDWGGTNDGILSHQHGLDLEMPCFQKRSKDILKSVARGSLSQEDLDSCSSHLYELLKKTSQRRKTSAWSYEKSHQLAIKAVCQSAVLLKNDSNILPLNDYSSTCVIGSLAKTPRYQGNGSSRVNPKSVKNFLEINDLPYADGYSLEGDDDGQLVEAVELAKKYDKVIMFLGLPNSKETEGLDRSDMKLPINQLETFLAIRQVNPNIIVILSCGSPVELPFVDQCRGLLLLYLPGEAGMEALDLLLLGKENPSGRLSESWPILYEDVPSSSFYPGRNRQAVYRESIFVGYRYYLSCQKKVAFPFGYGLSYSAFSYEPMSLSSHEYKDGTLTVDVKVKNESARDGYEVVQLYVSKKTHGVYRPLRELKAFKKVFIKANEQVDVALQIDERAFRVYDPSLKHFVIEEGNYLIQIASSSEKIEAEESIHVSSDYLSGEDGISLLSYFSPSKEGMNVSDEEFERVLGGKLPLPFSKASKPYTMNNTISDLDGTHLGRAIIRIIKRSVKKMSHSKLEEDSYLEGALQAPIRAGAMMANEKILVSLVDLCNGHFFLAIHHLFHSLKK